jgi:FMN-dependent NADH-azoreductase
MWNAGIPYILKQFIDVVSLPGMVFSFDAERGITEVAFRPNLATADAEMGRLRAHADARDAAKVF